MPSEVVELADVVAELLLDPLRRRVRGVSAPRRDARYEHVGPALEPHARIGDVLVAARAHIAYYADPLLTAFGGGLPVYAGQQVVGVLAVSGLRDQQDVDLAALAIPRMPSRLAST